MIASQTFWDRQAERYARSPIADEAAYAATLERVRGHIQPCDHVLELGCGTGTTALKLADAVARYTASDISAEMVRIGREKARQAAAETLDFVQGAPGGGALAGLGPFDVVMAFNLLHLLEDLPAALRGISALVRPGGLFISKTFCRPDRGEANREYRLIRLALPVMQLMGKAPFVAFMPVARLEAEIEAAGFEILETGNYPARPPRRFVVARRPGDR